MQSEMFIQYEDFSEEEIMCGISAGINSAAVLVWLATWPEELKPKVLHLYYAHFEEHSPDSFAFVKALFRYAKAKFKCVKFKVTRNSVIRFFEAEKMIPAPKLAPCTRKLKVIPMHAYMIDNGITTDLVGYVREETRRVRNMAKKTDNDIDGRGIQMDDVKKLFPISDKSNEWCFKIVEKEIGWYPAIYKLRWNDKGFIKYCKDNMHRLDAETQFKVKKKLGTRQRVFSHNNCLPCKNMQHDDYLAVEYFYKSYYLNSVSLAARLRAHWGRLIKETKGDKTIEDLQFHLDFGRSDEETGYEKQSCGVCAF